MKVNVDCLRISDKNSQSRLKGIAHVLYHGWLLTPPRVHACVCVCLCGCVVVCVWLCMYINVGDVDVDCVCVHMYMYIYAYVSCTGICMSLEKLERPVRRKWEALRGKMAMAYMMYR